MEGKNKTKQNKKKTPATKTENFLTQAIPKLCPKKQKARLSALLYGESP